MGHGTGLQPSLRKSSLTGQTYLQIVASAVHSVESDPKSCIPDVIISPIGNPAAVASSLSELENVYHFKLTFFHVFPFGFAAVQKLSLFLSLPPLSDRNAGPWSLWSASAFAQKATKPSISYSLGFFPLSRLRQGKLAAATR